MMYFGAMFVSEMRAGKRLKIIYVEFDDDRKKEKRRLAWLFHLRQKAKVSKVET